MSVWFALLAGVLVGLLIVASVLSARGRAGITLAAGLTAILVAAEQQTPHFDGYDTDFWTYALIAERVAEGQPMLDRDPFLLQPPPTPHLSLPWLLVGYVGRVTGLSAHAAGLGLSGLSAFLLTLAAWWVATRLFEAARERWIAVLLFWLGLHPAWATLSLGRTFALAFVLFAVAESLTPVWSLRRATLAAVWVALAFYTHLFGGVLALLGVGCGALARVDRVRERILAVTWTTALSALLALPCLLYALSTLGLERSHAHLHRPGQAVLLGLRYLEPLEIPRLASLPLVVLAALGLLERAPTEGRRVARRLTAIGAGVWVVALFTPVYDLAVRLVGGWMPERLVHLAFLWIAGTLALAARDDAPAGQWPRRLLASAAVVALGFQAGLQVGRDLEDRPLGALPRWRADPSPPLRRGGEARLFYALTDDARAEARSLRHLMRDRSFVSDPLLAYGVTASTLGRPLAVPAGHASPFGDFPTRWARVRGAFHANSARCWSQLLADYPDLELLLTPAPEAEVENRVWGRRVPPEAVRRVFDDKRALRPLFRGRFFVLDAIGPPLGVSSRPATTGEADGCLLEP